MNLLVITQSGTFKPKIDLLGFFLRSRSSRPFWIPIEGSLVHDKED